MKLLPLTVLLVGMFGNAKSQSTADTVISAKLLGVTVEKIANTKFKYRSVLTFSATGGRTFTINVPGEPEFKGAVHIPAYGLCGLRVDTVYTLTMRKTRLADIPIETQNFTGAFYNDGFVRENPADGRIIYRTLNQEAKKSDRYSVTTQYMDMDGYIYQLRELAPWHCAKRQF